MSEPEANPTTAQPTSEDSYRVLEAAKLRSEASVNRAEAALKRLEARRLLSKPKWIEFSIPGATVIVAVIGFLGSFVATYVQGYSDIELARQKYESDTVLARQKYDSDLVLKAVTNDAQQSRENIRFLLEAGLIKDPDGRIAKALADPALSIRIPSQIGANFQEDFTFDQVLIVVNEVKSAMNLNINIGARKIERKGMNAWAAVVPSGFEILYTQSLLDSLRRSSRTNWVVYAIVAHEVAHIALGHLSRGVLDRKQTELEADKWSGMALAKLRATLVEALAIHQSLQPPGPLPLSEPSREERLAAIESGWRSIGSLTTRQR